MKREYVKAAMSVVDVTPVSILAISKVRVVNEEYEIEDEEDILIKEKSFEDYLLNVR